MMQIIFVPLDLSDFQSVRKFVDEFKKLSLPLDGLVNNAGLMNDQRMTAKVYYISYLSLFNISPMVDRYRMEWK